MIRLTSMDKREIIINVYLIEQIEAVPETVITLTSGRKVIVQETVDQVVKRATDCYRTFHGAEEVNPDE